MKCLSHVICLSLFLMSSSFAFAQNNPYRMKFVFPFGEGGGTTSVCQTQYQTNNGCCEPPKNVYEYSLGAKGCCETPNEVHGTSPNERCCTPLKLGQNRWGQTPTQPCGGYCPAPNVISTYNGFSSCCSNCADVGGVVEFQMNNSVCGTCCSYTPVNCGNAGERVCEPTTGSAYCSQNSACSDPNEWSYGSTGEGGFTCCSTCLGTRYGHTNSSCGECCESATHIYLTVGTATSCCSNCNPLASRYGQTETKVCGICLACGAGAVYDDTTSSCKCADNHIGSWHEDTGNGNGCFPKTCEGYMLAAGYNAEKLSVAGDTITYSGKMDVTTDLDLSMCHLIVENTQGNGLVIAGSGTLKVKSVTGTGTEYGISNSGRIETTGQVKGKASGSGRGVYNTGEIEAATVSGEGSNHGVENGGIMTADIINGSDIYNASGGKMTAKSITGNGGMNNGVYNYGMMQADTIIGEGSYNGVVNTAGATMTTKTVTGSGTNNNGVYNSGELKATGAVKGTGKNTGISNSSATTVITGDTITGITTGTTSGTGISNYGTITATGDVTGEGGLYGISNIGSKSKITAQTVKGASIVISEKTRGITNAGTIDANEVIGESNFVSITNTGTMTATGSVTGTIVGTIANSIGVSNSGALTAKKVSGFGATGISSRGTINVETVIGNGNDAGLGETINGIPNISGGIYVTGGTVEGTTITGKGAYGIRCAGAINAGTVTGTATGTGSYAHGIYNVDGTITATVSVTGEGGSAGIYTKATKDKITAPKIYYCKTKTGSGVYSTTPVCKSGCTCTN